MKTPETAAEVTYTASSPAEFEQALTTWLVALRKVTNRPELKRRVTDSPPLLRSRLVDRGRCDATLAAWVDWLCESTGTPPPDWIRQPNRIMDFSPDDAVDLDPEIVAATPEAFRKHNIFHAPEPVVRVRRGRPRKSDHEKRRGNAERQRRFRQRVKAKLERLEQLERDAAKSGRPT